MADAGTEKEVNRNLEAKRPVWMARWGKRAGMIAFMFFFIKGLAWLVVPVALATWWAR